MLRHLSPCRACAHICAYDAMHDCLRTDPVDAIGCAPTGCLEDVLTGSWKATRTNGENTKVYKVLTERGSLFMRD